MDAGGRSTLTPDDTHSVVIDASDQTLPWGTVEWGAVRTLPARSQVAAWSAIVTDDGTGVSVTLDHDTVITAMTRMVADRATLNLNDAIVDAIARVLDARSNDAATDELTDLDSIGFDAIVQFALFGKIVYG